MRLPLLLLLLLLLLLVVARSSTARVLVVVGKRATQDGTALLAQTLAVPTSSRARLVRVDPTLRDDSQHVREAHNAHANVGGPPGIGYLSFGAHALMNEQQLSIVHTCTRHISATTAPPTTAATAADRMTTSDFARSALAHCTSAACAVERIKALADAHTLDCDSDGVRHRSPERAAAGAMAIADKRGDVWIVHVSRGRASASEWRAQRLADDHVAVVSPAATHSDAFALRDSEGTSNDDDDSALCCRMWRNLQVLVASPDARDCGNRCSAQSLRVHAPLSIADVMHLVRSSAALDSDPLLVRALLLQTRSGVPDALGGVLWSTASTSTSVFLPLSCAQQRVPGDASGRRIVQQALAAADSAVVGEATAAPQGTRQQEIDELQREAIALHARFVRELSRLGDSAAIARIIEWDLNAFATRAMAQQQRFVAAARPTARDASAQLSPRAMLVALAALALGALWHAQRRWRRHGYVRVSTELSKVSE